MSLKPRRNTFSRNEVSQYLTPISDEHCIVERSQFQGYNHWRIKYTFILIIIGVGKTSLIHKYIHGEFLSEYNITVGVDFKSKTVNLEDAFIQLQIWDTVFVL
jgi:hypothetical protein